MDPVARIYALLRRSFKPNGGKSGIRGDPTREPSWWRLVELEFEIAPRTRHGHVLRRARPCGTSATARRAPSNEDDGCVATIEICHGGCASPIMPVPTPKRQNAQNAQLDFERNGFLSTLIAIAAARHDSLHGTATLRAPLLAFLFWTDVGNPGESMAIHLYLRSQTADPYRTAAFSTERRFSEESVLSASARAGPPILVS